jgi:hypothetical protein
LLSLFGEEIDTGGMNNNCPIHRHNEIVYLDKTAKVGACEECLLKLVRSGHELMPIGKTVREVQSQLHSLENRMHDLSVRKKSD